MTSREPVASPYGSVQTGTASAPKGLYALNMQTGQLKGAVTAAWILTVGVLTYISDPTSVTGWTVLAVVAAIPPVVMMRLWRVPAQTVSESIREALR